MTPALHDRLYRFIREIQSPNQGLALLHGSWVPDQEAAWVLIPLSVTLSAHNKVAGTRKDKKPESPHNRIGLVSYTAASRQLLGTDGLGETHGLPVPDCFSDCLSASFKQALLLNHQGQPLINSDEALAEAWERCEQSAALRCDRAESSAESAGFTCGPFTAHWSYKAYQSAFNRVIDYIYAGDAYQVNLAQPFTADFSGDPLAAFLGVNASSSAPFSAYLEQEDWQLLCFSPEKFLEFDKQSLKTQPIKGTRSRGANPREDETLARELRESAKDRAENLMIVDLLRNDLGRISETGSVSVPELFAIESYSNVHHLVSTVTSRLRQDISPMQALLDCMPGGSITGAPKKRAMEIIRELETADRGAYCGSVFLQTDDWLCSNITIRTATVYRGKITLWGGGGIVADSDCLSEYRESIIKVDHIVKALGGPSLLDTLADQSLTI